MFHSVLKAACRRSYSSAPKPPSSNYKQWLYVSSPVLAGALAYILLEPYFPLFASKETRDAHKEHVQKVVGSNKPVATANTDQPINKKVDWEKVKQEISELMTSNLDYDGIGHYGPILVRLAWHSSGSYDMKDKTGGSNGATMRFSPESEFQANAGLRIARDLLEPLQKKYNISYGDLWTLAGVVAIEEMGGPKIDWQPGRQDAADGKTCPVDGRLPDASQGADHIRMIFNRMGFNDEQIVALSGAHVLGKCHTDRSGFKGPWTFNPTSFNNEYYKLLLSEEWIPKKEEKITDAHGKSKVIPWKGPLQYTDKKTKELMMLPTDMALVQDPAFKKYVEKFATDQDYFFKVFAESFSRLLKLGVPGQYQQ